MPLFLGRRKTPLSIEERRRRATTYRVHGFDNFTFNYPSVQATLPEKVVYQELMNRGYHFNFQTWFRALLPIVDFDRWYRPDFILPQQKIIIEVQGFYFHSQPEQIESDAFKYAIYEQMGYRVITWWDFDIMERIDSLFSEAGLSFLNQRGKRVLTGDEEERDDSAGIKKMNRMRGRPRTPTVKRSTASKSLFSYDIK